MTSEDLQSLPGLVNIQETTWSQIVLGKAHHPWFLPEHSLSLYLLQFRDQTSLNQAKTQLATNKETRHLLLNKQDAHMALIFIGQGGGAIAFIVLLVLFISAYFFSRRFLLAPLEQGVQLSLFGSYLCLAFEVAGGGLILTQGFLTVVNHSPMRLSFPLTLNAPLIPYAFLVASLFSLWLYSYQLKSIKKEA